MPQDWGVNKDFNSKIERKNGDTWFVFETWSLSCSSRDSRVTKLVTHAETKIVVWKPTCKFTAHVFTCFGYHMWPFEQFPSFPAKISTKAPRFGFIPRFPWELNTKTIFIQQCRVYPIYVHTKPEMNYIYNTRNQGGYWLKLTKLTSWRFSICCVWFRVSLYDYTWVLQLSPVWIWRSKNMTHW